MRRGTRPRSHCHCQPHGYSSGSCFARAQLCLSPSFKCCEIESSLNDQQISSELAAKKRGVGDSLRSASRFGFPARPPVPAEIQSSKASHTATEESLFCSSSSTFVTLTVLSKTPSRPHSSEWRLRRKSKISGHHPDSPAMLIDCPAASPACGRACSTWMACLSTRKTSILPSRTSFCNNTDGQLSHGRSRLNCKAGRRQRYDIFHSRTCPTSF